MNAFIDPAKAEDRDIFCGWCGAPAKGHWHGCETCRRPFYANVNGYARLCKTAYSICRRTECAGHAHGLCKMHSDARKQRQRNTAAQPNCRCGNKMAHDAVQCRGCDYKQEETNRQWQHLVNSVADEISKRLEQ